MFYESLISINKKFGLPLDVLKKLDYELTIIKPDDIISASLISIKTKINIEIIESILLELAYAQILRTRYIILCKNDDKELIHGFEFDTKKDLKEFIVNYGRQCPDCEYKLDNLNIRVVFLKRD